MAIVFSAKIADSTNEYTISNYYTGMSNPPHPCLPLNLLLFVPWILCRSLDVRYNSSSLYLQLIGRLLVVLGRINRRTL